MTSRRTVAGLAASPREARASCAPNVFQQFAPLDAATEAALRASIQRFGVLVPVVVDQHGRILDGHHRARIAGELQVDYPVIARAVGSDTEALEIARTLNTDRRHLTPEQRRPVVIALREEGHSYRAIGNALGVSEKTAWKDIEASPVTPVTPGRSTGLDGKTYPASRPAAEAPRRGLRIDRKAPYKIRGRRQHDLANAQKERLELGLSEISGICRGLADLDYGMVAAVLPPDEHQMWVNKTGELAQALRAIRSHLLEVKADAA